MATKRPNTSQSDQATIGLVMCSIEPGGLAEGSNKQMIQMMPVDADGNVTGVDGRSWKFNAGAFMSAVNRAKTDFPIDYEHASLKSADTGSIAPAAGWIAPSSIEIRADGVWGQAEWTDRAANAIRDREFRYTSPAFRFRAADRSIIGLTGAALTHYPNLGEQRPVANAQKTQEESMSDDLKERLIYMLNLPVTASDDDLKAELQKLISMLAAPVAANAQLGDDPRLTDVAAALISRLDEVQTAANSAGNLDPVQFVPRAEFDRVKDELSTLTASHKGQAVETAVNAAIDAGKIAPVSRDWAVDYCTKDPDGFAAFVGTAAPVIPLGEEANRGGAGGTQLSEIELAFCTQMGNSPEDYIQTKKEEEAHGTFH